MKKSWLEELDTPVIQLGAVTGAQPVRGHYRSRQINHKGTKAQSLKRGKK